MERFEQRQRKKKNIYIYIDADRIQLRTSNWTLIKDALVQDVETS